MGDNRAFSVLLALGLVLRLAATIAYRPAILYFDSFRYLDMTRTSDPSGLDPLGYSVLFLRPVLAVSDLRAIPVLQHLIGLGIALVIYRFLRHWSVPKGLAALAAAPILLDAFQVQIEQNVMVEPLFEALLLGALVLLAWRRHPGAAAVAAAGLLVGTAVTVRMAGQAVIPVVGLYVVAVAPGWRRRLAHGALVLVGAALPLAAYAGWYHHVAGHYRLVDPEIQARMRYARVAPIVDCDIVTLTRAQRQLCPVEPLGQRERVDYYMHATASPAFSAVPPPGQTRAQLLSGFTRAVVARQPLAVARTVATDVIKAFAPRRITFGDDVEVDRFLFQTRYPVFDPNLSPAQETAKFGGGRPRATAPFTTLLRAYQVSIGYVPGPLLGAGALLGLVAGWRGRRHWRGRTRTRPTTGAARSERAASGGAAALFSLTGMALVVLAAGFQFSWRYQIPQLVFFPVSGVLGWTSLSGRFRDRRGDRAAGTEPAAPSGAASQLTAGAGSPPAGTAGTAGTAGDGDTDRGDDPVDAGAVAAFGRLTEGRPLAPVAVVIAAYDEEDAIAAVLDDLPREVEGLGVDAIVVVDGATDATAEVARAHGALVCEVPVNRGQGAALRLGYRLAREGGARFIATTDADGQYDGRELDRLLAPLVSGEADFVSGSRRLGREETTDGVRRLGVRVFAWVLSRVTGQRITDPANGFRAMRAEVSSGLRLEQPQYQASELLIAVAARGYRIAEVPTTMRPRAAGETKKGGNLMYGLRFTRVVVRTWRRERRRAAPRADGAGTPAGRAGRT